VYACLSLILLIRTCPEKNSTGGSPPSIAGDPGGLLVGAWNTLLQLSGWAGGEYYAPTVQTLLSRGKNGAKLDATLFLLQREQLCLAGGSSQRHTQKKKKADLFKSLQGSCPRRRGRTEVTYREKNKWGKKPGFWS